MKKFLLSILTFIYLMLSTGFSLDVHYCMGELSGVELYGKKDEACAKCGMKEKKGGCCRDEHKFYKFENNFKCDKSVSFDHQLVMAEPLSFVDCFSHSIPFTNDLSYQLYKQPEPGGPPVYLRNRFFRL